MSETCPDIQNIEFSQESKSSLRLVQSKLKFGSLLKLTVSAGTLFAALYEDKAIPQMVNIKTTDWHLLGQVMVGIPEVEKREIEKISMGMATRTNGDEYKFWKALFLGCKL